MNSNDEIVIVGMSRTPIGNFQGELSNKTGPDLGGSAIEAAIKNSKISPSDIDDVIAEQDNPIVIDVFIYFLSDLIRSLVVLNGVFLKSKDNIAQIISNLDTTKEILRHYIGIISPCAITLCPDEYVGYIRKIICHQSAKSSRVRYLISWNDNDMLYTAKPKSSFSAPGI